MGFFRSIGEWVLEMWSEGWAGRAAMVLLSACAAGMIYLLLFLLEVATAHTTSETGIVVAKDHSPGWYQPVVVSSGKATTTTLIYHPPSYRLVSDDLTRDHVQPKAFNGRNRDNIVPACTSCNIERGQICAAVINMHVATSVPPITSSRRGDSPNCERSPCTSCSICGFVVAVRPVLAARLTWPRSHPGSAC